MGGKVEYEYGRSKGIVNGLVCRVIDCGKKTGCSM